MLFRSELFARGAIEANEEALLRVGHGGDGEEPAAKDDGRGVAFAGKFGTPDDVFGLAPRSREGGFGAASVVARAAPGGPVVSVECGGECEEKEESDEHCGKLGVSVRTGQACGGGGS